MPAPILTKRTYRTTVGWRLDVTSEWARLYSPTDAIGLDILPVDAVRLVLADAEHGKWVQDPE